MARKKILLVDDEDAIRFAVHDYLETTGFAVEEAADLRKARALLRTRMPDAIVLDHRLPDGESLDLISEIRAFNPTVPIIVLTGHGTIDLAVSAVKSGADHFLTKPVELPALKVSLERALAAHRA